MEAGKARRHRRRGPHRARPDRRDDRVGRRLRLRRRPDRHRALRLPDLRLVLGHVHRQLDELPDRGARPVAARQRLHAGHQRARAATSSWRPAAWSSTCAAAATTRTTSRCCRAPIATRAAFTNAMRVDIAMGGSTNTVLHLLAAAREGGVDFDLDDIDALCRRTPCICKVAPQLRCYHMEDVHRAGGIPAILGELDRAGLLDRSVHAVHAPTWTRGWRSGTSARGSAAPRRASCSPRRPAGCAPPRRSRSTATWDTLDTDSGDGLHPRRRARLQRRRRPGRAARQPRPGRRVVKTAGVAAEPADFNGPAKVSESQEEAVERDPRQADRAGDVVVIRYEGPKGGPGMQEMLYPTSFLKGRGLGAKLRADHRRPVLRRHQRAVHRPRLPGGGRAAGRSAWSRTAT